MCQNEVSFSKIKVGGGGGTLEKKFPSELKIKSLYMSLNVPNEVSFSKIKVKKQIKPYIFIPFCGF